jgi:glucan phosphorylase
MITKQEIFRYDIDPGYLEAVAYFSMEFAVEKSLKIYSGGLGFLAGSHLRSAYQLRQNLVGVGMLWKYGYYDQTRDAAGLMKPDFMMLTQLLNQIAWLISIIGRCIVLMMTIERVPTENGPNI